MQYGLVGAKLGHSWSPEIHAQLGDYEYKLIERTEEEFIELLSRRDFKGLNVTIPYKKVAYAHCDVLTDAAREVGCVNTLTVGANGELIGHNTDIDGFIAMARRAGVTIAGKKCAILGSGGTSLTARAACRRLSAAEIVVVSRSGPVDYEALYQRHADAQVLINTTPVGMYPRNGECPADLHRLPNLTGVLDVIYNPSRTALILEAQSRNLPCASGLFMLVEQARAAAEAFTGQAIDPAASEAIYRRLRQKMMNVVLIGMPGSGKTTLGAALARALGRRFVDLDDAVVARAGMSIPQLFAQRGEAAFRDLEATVLAEACAEKDAVIATGGGAVLRPDNVRALRENAAVLWVRRPLEALSTEGRPLSASAEALQRMQEARTPLYAAAADAAIDNDASPDEALLRALDRLASLL